MVRSHFADNVIQDIRFAVRQLRKSPLFALTAIAILALGLCAAIAIFAFVDGALIRPLPYRSPSRLVGVYERVQVFPRSNLSFADYLDWKRRRARRKFEVYMRDHKNEPPRSDSDDRWVN